MDSNSELDTDLEYDLQNLFELSEDEESYKLSSELSFNLSSSSKTSTPRPKYLIRARI